MCILVHIYFISISMIQWRPLVKVEPICYSYIILQYAEAQCAHRYHYSMAQFKHHVDERHKCMFDASMYNAESMWPDVYIVVCSIIASSADWWNWASFGGRCVKRDKSLYCAVNFVSHSCQYISHGFEQWLTARCLSPHSRLWDWEFVSSTEHYHLVDEPLFLMQSPVLMSRGFTAVKMHFKAHLIHLTKVDQENSSILHRSKGFHNQKSY